MLGGGGGGERKKLGGSSCVPFWSRHAFLNKFDTLRGYNWMPLAHRP